jgi:hypothetical protein
MVQVQGRKLRNRTKNYNKGYAAGYQRAKRKNEGEVPALHKKIDSKKPKQYQEGLNAGIRAFDKGGGR